MDISLAPWLHCPAGTGLDCFYNDGHDSPAAAAGDTTGEIGSAHTEVLYLPADGPSPCTSTFHQNCILAAALKSQFQCPPELAGNKLGMLLHTHRAQNMGSAN